MHIRRIGVHGSGRSDRGYFWNFGDGSGGAGAIVTHSYKTGTYTASLVVVDNLGQSGNTAQRTLSVVNQPPVPSFTVTCVGLHCTYDASSSSDADDGIYFRWTFGDGGWSGDRTGTHDYWAAGTYTIALTVSDSAQQAVTTSRAVTVAPRGNSHRRYRWFDIQPAEHLECVCHHRRSHRCSRRRGGDHRLGVVGRRDGRVLHDGLQRPLRGREVRHPA